MSAFRFGHSVLASTGGTERLLLDAIAERRVTHPAEPTVLVAHRSHNSLLASLETLAAIQQSGGRGRIISLSDRDAAFQRAHPSACQRLEQRNRRN